MVHPRRLEKSLKHIGDAQEINNETVSNFFIRAVTRVGSWATNTEDRLFAAAVVNHTYEQEERPSSKEAERLAREFDEAANVAKRDCRDIWWFMFVCLVVIPHASTILGFTTIALVMDSVVTGEGSVPYALLFYGTLAVILTGMYFAKLVLDDLNQKRHSRVLSRWHQILTALEMLVVTLLIAYIQTDGVIMLTTCLMETVYLSSLCIALRVLPFDFEKTAHGLDLV